MNRTMFSIALALCLALPIQAESRAGIRLPGERMIVVVPLEGKGTAAEPRVPAVMPTSDELRDKTKMISFTWTASDDGQFAILDISGSSRAALSRFRTNAKAASVFERGRNKAGDVEKELRKLRKDFKLDKNVEVKHP